METLFTLENAKKFEHLSVQIENLMEKIKDLNRIKNEVEPFIIRSSRSVELSEAIKIKILNYAIFELTEKIKRIKEKQKTLIFNQEKIS